MKNPLSILLAAAVLIAGCGDSITSTSSSPIPTTRLLGNTATISSTAIAGYRDAYTISVSGSNVAVTGKSDNVTTTYTTSQELNFYDRTVSFDISGIAGQAYRLYQAAFNRRPDPAGLGYWINALSKGQSLNQVSSSFQSSDEFRSLYGASVTSSQWITLVYSNVLHRSPDADGLKWWVSTLDAGADKASALVGFSESGENKAALAGTYQNGIEYERVGGPRPVRPTSYLNAKALNIPAQQIPTYPSIAGTDGWSEGATGGVAFADFLRDGSISLVTFTNIWMKDPAKAKAGSVHFYKYVNGNPIDITSSLLKDTTGCFAPRKLLVADFNNDGRPDVFASCHGPEKGDFHTWPGEHPRLLLSQADGSYLNIEVPIQGYFHGAAAADINGDGKIDVVLYDGLRPAKSPSEFAS